MTFFLQAVLSSRLPLVNLTSSTPSSKRGHRQIKPPSYMPYTNNPLPSPTMSRANVTSARVCGREQRQWRARWRWTRPAMAG